MDSGATCYWAVMGLGQIVVLGDGAGSRVGMFTGQPQQAAPSVVGRLRQGCQVFQAADAREKAIYAAPGGDGSPKTGGIHIVGAVISWMGKGERT